LTPRKSLIHFDEAFFLGSMKNITNNSELIYTALFAGLWGVMEVTVGTILHTSRLPFRGTLLTIAAVVIITIARSFINYRGSILALCTAAATIKLITLPGFNITPFIAIMMEGLIGEAVFTLMKYKLWACVVAGSSIMIYTLLHSLIMQGVFFGMGIYNVYIDLMNSLGKGLNYDGEMSYIMIPIIISLYLIVGGAAGVFGWKTANRSKEILAAEGV